MSNAARPALDRLLPQDPDAERATLGSMLLDPEAIGTAVGILGADKTAFNLEAHQMVYSAILAVHERGEPVGDGLVIKAELERRGQWERVGKFDMLGSLMAAVPSALRVEHYCGLVRDKWLRRRLIQATHQISERAFNGVGAGDLFAGALADIGALAETAQLRGPAPASKPVVEWASDIIEQPVAWLWPDRLERGALNMLAADPGAGKSLMTAALAAAVSLGAPWPDSRHDYGRPPQKTLLVTAEDDPRKATVPRLRAAGADMSRVAILRTVVEDREERQLCLQRDLGAIEDAIVKAGDVALVVLDPLDSYLGRGDSNANEEMRRVLEPLVALAERTNVCFLAIKHLNKSIATPNALYRIAGTMAFVALPRTVHIVGRDPDDPDRRRNLFVPVKVSHGPKPDALAYIIERTGDGLPRLEWHADTVAADADEVLGGKRPTAKSPGAIDRATGWLKATLAAGPLASKELEGLADSMGIPRGTLNRAKEQLREAGAIVAKQIRKRGKVAGWSVELAPETV